MIRWAASSEFGTYRLCEQRRFRRACASAQSRQNLRCSLIQTVSQGEPSDRKPDPWPFWMAGHAHLKFVMTECSKTQIRLTGLRYFYHVVMFLLKIVRARKCKYIVYINMSCYFITQKLYFHQDAISSHLSQLVIKNNVSIFTLQNPPTNPSRKSFLSRGTLQSIKVFVFSCHLSLWPTLKFLSIGTGRSAHTVQTQIRPCCLISLHCVQSTQCAIPSTSIVWWFHCLVDRSTLFKFSGNSSINSECPKFEDLNSNSYSTPTS